MPQEGGSGTEPLAFLGVTLEVEAAQPVEHLLHVEAVFVAVPRMDEYIVHVHECELLESLEHVPHDSLEDWWGVLQPEGENCPLEVASPSDSNRDHERCDRDAGFLHGNLVVPLLEVNLAVVSGSRELRQQLINAG